MRTIVLMVIGTLLASCGSGQEAEQMAGQMARLNRDVALLLERLSALEARLAVANPRGASAPGPAAAPMAGGKSPGAAADTAPGSVLQIALADASGPQDSGGARVDGALLPDPKLRARLAAHAKSDPQAQVAIQAAVNAPRKRIIEVMEMAWQSGIQRISVTVARPSAASL